MAGWASGGRAALKWPSRSIVAALLISATAGQSALSQSSEANSGVTLGIPVTYESSDGSERLILTVEEIFDPFVDGLTGYDRDRLASEGNRYVGVRLMVGNDAPEPFPYFTPWSISLLDADAVHHKQKPVQLGSEVAAAHPRLPAGDVPAGGFVSGTLFYELPEATDIEAVLFAPSSGLPVSLADRGTLLASTLEPTPLPTISEPVLATPAPPAAPRPTSTAEPDASPGSEDPVETAKPETSAATASGNALLYEESDGSMSIALMVEEIIDPLEAGLTAFGLDQLAANGTRIVALRLYVENIGDEALTLLPTFYIKLLDDQTVLHQPTRARRNAEAAEDDPELPGGALAASASTSGLLFYEVPADVEVASVIFTPTPDRLMTLAGGDPRSAHPGTEGAGRPPLETLTLALDDLAAAGTYQAPAFHFEVTWDPRHWSVGEATTEPGHDRLVLEGPVMSIELDGSAADDTDLRACRDAAIHADLDDVVGFDGPADDIMPPTTTGWLSPDAGLYVVNVQDESNAETFVRYVECRTIAAGDAVLRVIVTAPERYWAVDRPLATAVLLSILASDSASIAGDRLDPIQPPQASPSPDIEASEPVSA